jgi:hypothetical protein
MFSIWAILSLSRNDFEVDGVGPKEGRTEGILEEGRKET